MKTLVWFNQLMKSPELINLLPMQVQPGLPVPFEKDGLFQLYVPFYHMWQKGDKTMISPALYTVCYSMNTLRMVSYMDHEAYAPEMNEKPLAIGELTPESIRRKSMNIQYAFEMLDDMRSILQRRGNIPSERLDEYNKTFVRLLPMEEMKFMYSL